MADIVLKDRQGVPQTYAGYAKVAFNTPDSGTVIFSEGEATENVPIDLNLAAGDQTVTAENGTLIKSAVIKKPTTLTPENVAKDVNVAGVVGTFIGNGVENVEIIPDFSAGDQTITAEADTLIKSAIVRKPDTLVPENIAKGVEVSGVIGTLSSGAPVAEKDINFYDYDGTLVESWSLNELASKTELPENPQHTSDIVWGGQVIPLTSQGWNWSLADLKSNDDKMDVGQTYKPSDDSLHVLIELEKGRLSPYFGLWINGTAVIDWGDGSETDSITGSGALINTQHTYSREGKYRIKVTPVGTITWIINGDSNYSKLLWSNSSDKFINQAYNSCVKGAFIPESMNALNNYSFCYCGIEFVTIPLGYSKIRSQSMMNCGDLKFVTVPTGAAEIETNAFYTCDNKKFKVSIPKSIATLNTSAFSYSKYLSLKYHKWITRHDTQAIAFCKYMDIYLCKGVSKLYSYMFQGCIYVKHIGLPESVTLIGWSSFYECMSLCAIDVPAAVTTIEDYAFYNCRSIGKIRFNSKEPPTISGSSTFSGIPTDCVISVPTGSLEAYTAATNYPDSSTYTYIEED